MCIKCDYTMPQMASIDKEIERIAKAIYDGDIKAGDVDEELLEKIAKQLTKGLAKGFKDADYVIKDAEFVAQMERNIYVFSGMKNYQQLKETASLLLDENGQIRSFKDFLADVKAINATYNEVYLGAEYNNALAQGQMAAQWKSIEENKDIRPKLRYVTAGDSEVRPEHAILDGVVLPVDDPFWSMYYPPNDWGCRCDVLMEDEDTPNAEPPELPELKPMFEHNVGKDGVIFPDTHPYFDAPKKDIDRVTGIAEGLYNKEEDE
jgi:SPP1 gp7 family putative phage head morphogenesis protein